MIHRFVRAAVIAAAVLASCALQARIKEVEPGQAVTLQPGEGLLLVAVQAAAAAGHLRIKRNGALFDGGTLRDLPQGESARLFVVEAGRYRYDELRVGQGFRYDLGSDPEFGFDVQPGRINYPGHLLFTPTGWFSASFHVPNRGLLAIDWLEKHHPALYAKHEFAYAGHYPDPFPAHYRAAAKPGTRVRTRTAPMPRPGVLPMTVASLWEAPAVQWADVNDRGDLVALVVRDDFAQRWNVQVLERATGKQHTVFQWGRPIDELQWSGDRALVLSLSGDYAQGAKVVRIAGGPPGGAFAFETLHFPRQGEVIGLLPRQDAVLFAIREEHNGSSELQVHRVDISSQAALSAARFRKRDALDRGVGNERAWFADGRGRLRAALALRDEKLVLMHGADGKFAPAMTLDGDSTAMPLGLSADGEILYAYTEQGRGQRDLVEIVPATGRVGKTLFSKPGADVQGAIFDAAHALVGARYYEGGQLVSHYFDAASEAVYRKAQARFPGKELHVVDRDASGTNYLVTVAASNQVGELHLYDVAADRATLLQDMSPWLDDRRLSPSTVLKARSADGFDIEAYLTMPLGAWDARPLVVLPHGGPIGVRDTRGYSPEVQFLASLGYAVMQVNFRGSEGFGTAFREAGTRSYGTRIEDDIAAALDVALRDYPLDAGRVCVVGSSYGGYSALMSAIRWPARFRCVVSMSGISDRPLFFTASDSGRRESGRKALERYIGDPRKDAEEMRANSPLYRSGELRTPVMLVHGERDLRVDYEHTRRLQRMLNLAGVVPVVVSMPAEGHGIVDPETRRVVWEGVAGFLRQHLGHPAAGAAAAP